MKISKLHLSNFRRFTDLSIENIPESTKLVLLIGSNGSGKSSVFDAFAFVTNCARRDNLNDLEYYKKKSTTPFEVSINYDQGEISLSNNNINTSTLPLNAFYGRTSYRQTPRLTRRSLGESGFNIENDSDRSPYFIEKDNRFENDIEKITETILKDLFRTQRSRSNEQIHEHYINPINKALKNIFGEGNATKLQLIEIIPPLEGNIAQINFRKGNSEIHYNFLSAGEKEVFNLLVNLLSRLPYYQNTIYFLDEIDLHLNTKLQFSLLKEITENWIPENCQLWTATHSLGFIEYANRSDEASIIDFDDFDFDLPRVLSPMAKDNPDIYEIAVGKEFLSSLFHDKNICFVENNDKGYYASLGINDTVFVSDNNRNSVYHKVRTLPYYGIVDRDFLSDDDIAEIKEHYRKIFILDFYSIENYFYHPDNLEEYYQGAKQAFDKTKYVAQLTDTKNQIKDSFIPSIGLKRTEYPYFGEPLYNGTPLQNRFKNKQENEFQSKTIAEYINSNDFNLYFKSLPMKSYCTQLPQRQNISKNELAKTIWFKTQIENLLKF